MQSLHAFSTSELNLMRDPRWGRSQESPFEVTATNEYARRLEHKLAQLRPEYREVLLLVAVEGMAHAQAAAVCGLKPEAFRKRLSRAREMLAEMLEAPAHGRIERKERS